LIGAPLRFTVCRPILKSNVLALEISEIAQPLQESLRGRGTGVSQITNPRNFRRWLRVSGQARRKEHGAKRKANDFSSHELLLWFFLLTALCLLSSDHLVRTAQYSLRNRQADLLRRLEIYHQLKLRGPLYW